MTTQTFASASLGSIAARALASVPLSVAVAVRDSLSGLSQDDARDELARMADQHANRAPGLARRLRDAARRNWFGEA